MPFQFCKHCNLICVRVLCLSNIKSHTFSLDSAEVASYLWSCLWFSWPKPWTSESCRCFLRTSKKSRSTFGQFGAAGMSALYRTVEVKEEQSCQVRLRMCQSIYDPTLTHDHELLVRRTKSHFPQSVKDRLMSSFASKGAGWGSSSWTPPNLEGPSKHIQLGGDPQVGSELTGGSPERLRNPQEELESVAGERNT